MPLLLYAGLAAGFFWPLLLHLSSGLHDRSDTVLNTWIIGWETHILPRAPLALLDAPIFHPLPNTLALSEILWPAAPATLPLSLATQAPLLVHNLLFLLSFPLAGFGAYLLALHVTGNRPGALLAGIIYAFSPHQFGHLSQLQLLSIGWLPLMLLFLDRFWEQGKPPRRSAPGLDHGRTVPVRLLLCLSSPPGRRAVLALPARTAGQTRQRPGRPVAAAASPGALGRPGCPAHPTVPHPLLPGAQPIGAPTLSSRHPELRAAVTDYLLPRPGHPLYAWLLPLPAN